MKYSRTKLTEKLVTSETTDYILNNVTNTYSNSDISLRVFNTIGETYDELIEIIMELSKQGSIKGTTWLLDEYEKPHNLDKGNLTIDERKIRLRDLKYNRKGFTPYRAKQLLKEITGCTAEIIENVDSGTFEIVFINPKKINLQHMNRFDRYKHSELIYRISNRFSASIKFKTYNARYVNTYEDLEAGFLEAGTDLDNRIRSKYAKIKFRTSKYRTISYFPEAGEYEAGDEY